MAGDLNVPGGRDSHSLRETGVHRRAYEQCLTSERIEADPVVLAHITRFGPKEDALAHLHRERDRDPERRLLLPHVGDLRERDLWIIEKIEGAVEAIFDEFFIGGDQKFTAVIGNRLSARIVN